MRYKLEKDGDVLLATLHGSVWGLLEDYQLKDEIKVQLDQGERKVLLDFQDVDRVNSIGIGITISALASTKAVKGRFGVCTMNQRVFAAFEVTGVMHVLKIYPSRDEAMKDFNG